MKLLILTQKVDINDPVLGFFHNWIARLAQKCESVIVICLWCGDYNLPDNVRVLSLGKEQKLSRLRYVFLFFRYIWQERLNYQAVFVHMNQEYVLLGGLFWKTWRKKIFMWRNHHSGNWLTNISALFCEKIFCTSRFSYTAKYQNVVIMPVGIDTELFCSNPKIVRKTNSLLFLSRMDPVKKADLLLDAVEQIVANKAAEVTVSFYGDPSPNNAKYFRQLKQRVSSGVLSNNVMFFKGIPNHQTPNIYNEHEIFINLSSSGMYDKTIFEAASCGNLVLSCNRNLNDEIDGRMLFEEDSSNDLSKKIIKLLKLSDQEKLSLRKEMRRYVLTKHSLGLLIDKLVQEMS